MSQRLAEEAKKRERFEELKQHLEQEQEVVNVHACVWVCVWECVREADICRVLKLKNVFVHKNEDKRIWSLQKKQQNMLFPFFPPNIKLAIASFKLLYPDIGFLFY